MKNGARELALLSAVTRVGVTRLLLFGGVNSDERSPLDRRHYVSAHIGPSSRLEFGFQLGWWRACRAAAATAPRWRPREAPIKQIGARAQFW